ncbi:FkbM family methyltransferase [Lysobacter sp. H21R4]|uniref:FkbM family methyltransferase n=1 Tax=Lysobacter sp. H21R4 TaxID=2781021 RepID=UPI00188994C6|nr:FkbM family methyltransferase [Lysobacter sp. H21R4]QOY62388.1 FkbM family methyltransferase [Lysobacter sp. H21R4]
MIQLISYAQNFEDIILWRALGHVEEGCYVDIGAQSPDADSVSRVFFEHGWRGLHVEPTAQYAAELRERRPDETVLQALIAEDAGVSRFFEITGTGLSTMDEAIANTHKLAGFEVRESLVPVMTMDTLLPQVGDRDIHWLKIDVEGAELAVLRGWKTAPHRPWVLVIESTRPLSREQTHQQWEPLVLEKGYKFAHFDGLNRFYVSVDRPELLPAFESGPNVFDGFSLAPTSEFCASVNIAYHALELRREAEEQAAHASLAEIQGHLGVADAEIGRLGAEKLAQQAEYEALAQAEQQRAESALRRVDELEMRCAEHLRREEELTEEIGLREAEVTKLSAQARIEQARISGLRDAHMAQIDRFQTHVAWLDGVAEGYRHDKQAAQSKADDAKHEAHRWWVEAEQLRHELAQIKGSRSWRSTAPLRTVRRLASTLVRSPIQGGKHVARPLVVRCMRAVLGVGPLRVVMLRALDAHPGLKSRLRDLAQRAGLIEAPAGGLVAIQHALPSSVARAHAIPKSVLQVRADQVLADLRHAIQEKHG